MDVRQKKLDAKGKPVSDLRELTKRYCVCDDMACQPRSAMALEFIGEVRIGFVDFPTEMKVPKILTPAFFNNKKRHEAFMRYMGETSRGYMEKKWNERPREGEKAKKPRFAVSLTHFHPAIIDYWQTLGPGARFPKTIPNEIGRRIGLLEEDMAYGADKISGDYMTVPSYTADEFDREMQRAIRAKGPEVAAMYLPAENDGTEKAGDDSDDSDDDDEVGRKRKVGKGNGGRRWTVKDMIRENPLTEFNLDEVELMVDERLQNCTRTDNALFFASVLKERDLYKNIAHDYRKAYEEQKAAVNAHAQQQQQQQQAQLMKPVQAVQQQHIQQMQQHQMHQLQQQHHQIPLHQQLPMNRGPPQPPKMMKR